MKKRFWLILLVVVLLFLGWRIYELIADAKKVSGTGGGRPPVAVETETIHRGAIRDIRQFTGSITPYYRYLVAPKVSGRVVRFNKRIGDYVERNEIIVRIDDAEYQQAYLEADANLRIARASLSESRAQLELAQKEFERAESLREQGLAAPSDLDAVRSRFEAQRARLNLAEAQVEQRAAALESARIRLDYTILRASEPGYIGERLVDEGALLSTNTPVASVLGIDTVYVRSTIIERDYGQVRIGQQATVMVDAFPGREFAGRVSRIAPMLREESRVAEMEVVVQNPGLHLKPGMFARIAIELDARSDALLAPKKALISRDGIEGLFMVADGEKVVARWVPVEVGIRGEDSIEILAPRDLAGEVITLGQHLVDDGSVILIPDQRAQTGGQSGEGG